MEKVLVLQLVIKQNDFGSMWIVHQNVLKPIIKKKKFVKIVDFNSTKLAMVLPSFRNVLVNENTLLNLMENWKKLEFQLDFTSSEVFNFLRRWKWHISSN